MVGKIAMNKPRKENILVIDDEPGVRKSFQMVLKDKYIKLCWMGMGDAFFDLEKMSTCTKQILDYVFNIIKAAKGLDGVDIGTVFPKYHDNLKVLNLFPLNFF